MGHDQPVCIESTVHGHDDHDGHDGYDGHDGHTGHDGHDGHDSHDGDDYCIKGPFGSCFYIYKLNDGFPNSFLRS